MRHTLRLVSQLQLEMQEGENTLKDGTGISSDDEDKEAQVAGDNKDDIDYSENESYDKQHNDMAGEDDHNSDEDDLEIAENEDKDEDEDEEYIDHFHGETEHTYQLATGTRLRLCEALFQLSMMF